MLRSFSDEELELLDKRVVVMIWLYYESNYALAVKLAAGSNRPASPFWAPPPPSAAEGPEPPVPGYALV